MLAGHSNSSNETERSGGGFCTEPRGWDMDSKQVCPWQSSLPGIRQQFVVAHSSTGALAGVG